MSNELKMADQTAIIGLWKRGWSARRIARETGIHRETVGRYVRLARAGPKPAISTTGSESSNELVDDQSNDSKPAISIAGSGRRSWCEPYQQIIQEKLLQGLTAQRIWQDLAADGFQGSDQSVRRYCRRIKATTELPMRRIECEPGAEAQVDFGSGAPVITPEGKRRKTHVFRIILSHSRKGYSEAVYHQTADDFIRCIENAFWYFGGVPKTLVIDNLKAAVRKADWFDPELNPKIQSFCQHYGTIILPTKPRMPRHKGKVERGVGYVKSNALKAKSFKSLTEQNQHLLQWEHQVADTRVHGTTRHQVRKAFTEVERDALGPLPIERFELFHESRRQVNRDGHISVQKAYYSVPPEYLGRQVWVRWDGRLVRVFNHRFEQIAVHAQQEPGRFSTQSRHISQQKRSGIEQGAHYLLGRASRIGSRTGQWAEQMLHQRGVQGVRVLMGLLSLANRHAPDQLEQACEVALTHGAYRLRTIRELLKRHGDRQQQFEFIDEHPIIRPLSDYADLVHTSITKEPWQ